MPTRPGTKRCRAEPGPLKACCFEQTERFFGDHRRRQDHGERKTEFLQFLLGQAEQQSGGNGRAGTRKSAERQADALHDADPARVRRLNFRMARGFLLPQPGINNQRADRRQRPGDQRQVRKQFLDLGVRQRRA